MPADLLQPIGGWAGPSQPRLIPQPLAERGVLFRAVSRVSRLFGRPELPNVFPLIHHNPRLFWGWMFFASRLMPWGRLPATARELMILRVAWLCRCRYEWGQHIELAERAGVSDRDLVAVTRGPEAFDDPATRLLIQACDDLYHHDCLTDDTWQPLQAQYSEKLLLEVMMLAGHYRMLAGVLLSAGLPLEAHIEEHLQGSHARVAGLVEEG
ncbi:MAG: carboxymuconolactone decarboxylase family protein [Alcanivorax sp.]|nr:carboxymuconolactone decarboxylase family protein [Alcanivorax sp.]